MAINGWVERKLEDVAATVALEGERTRAEMAAAFTQTVRGLRVDGSAARPLPAKTAIVYGDGARRLVGWSARETGGTNDVSVDLYDGTDDGAVDPSRLVASFNVAAGKSTAHTFMPAGISFGQGLYAVVSGTGVLRGVALIGAVD